MEDSFMSSHLLPQHTITWLSHEVNNVTKLIAVLKDFISSVICIMCIITKFALSFLALLWSFLYQSSIFKMKSCYTTKSSYLVTCTFITAQRRARASVVRHVSKSSASSKSSFSHRDGRKRSKVTSDQRKSREDIERKEEERRRKITEILSLEDPKRQVEMFLRFLKGATDGSSRAKVIKSLCICIVLIVPFYILLELYFSLFFHSLQVCTLIPSLLTLTTDLMGFCHYLLMSFSLFKHL